MTVSPIERLVRLNPVPEAPPVPPAELLCRSIVEDLPAARLQERITVRRRAGRLRLALAVSAMGACAASVLLAVGSSNTGVNVLAAVYAATSAEPVGIVESLTITHSYPGPGRERTERLREWSEASTRSRRGLTVFTNGSPAGADTTDVLYTPGVWELWNEGPGAARLPWGRRATKNAIVRVRWTGSRRPDSQMMGFGGEGGLVGDQFAELFRNLYLKHQLRVVGRVRHAGRLLWKLEATPALAARRAREDGTQYYVLVDPETFLPVYTRLIDLARPGHPTMSESELVSYRTLASTPANEKLFDLSVQHPRARVLTRTVAFPQPPRLRGSRSEGSTRPSGR